MKSYFFVFTSKVLEKVDYFVLLLEQLFGHYFYFYLSNFLAGYFYFYLSTESGYF